jgi:hypothetical protein
MLASTRRHWNSCALLVGYKMDAAVIKGWCSLKKASHGIIMLFHLSCIPPKLKARTQVDTCIPMFTAALFTIVKI